CKRFDGPDGFFFASSSNDTLMASGAAGLGLPEPDARFRSRRQTGSPARQSAGGERPLFFERSGRIGAASRAGPPARTNTEARGACRIGRTVGETWAEG